LVIVLSGKLDQKGSEPLS